MLATSATGSRFYGVKSDDVLNLWSSVFPLLSKAINHPASVNTPKAVLEGLMCASLQLWVSFSAGGAIEAALVTRIDAYPRRKVCALLFAGGLNHQNWKEFISVVEAWAKAQDCSLMEISGRRGWERVMGKFGYFFSLLTLAKEI
jgi:hypothetical protein